MIFKMVALGLSYCHGMGWPGTCFPRFIRQVVRSGWEGGWMRLEKGPPGENAVVSYWAGKG